MTRPVPDAAGVTDAVASDAAATGPVAVGVEERLARAALSRLAEPGTPVVRAAVAAFGPVRTWAELRAGTADPRLHAAVETRLAACDPERDLDRLHRAGGRLVCPGDAEWPAALDDLQAHETGPPLALWVRGPVDLRAVAAGSVAVVGSRAASAYGEYVAAELAGGLAERGWTVCSGGAYGIDAAAHRGALATGGSTVAFLACGVDVAYPRGHAGLFGRVVETGLLVSESPPGAAPQRLRFLTRNRLIAALTAGTVVVEAGFRSGALSTARHAERLSRHLMAVPGPVTAAVSAGCHRLIREGGATLVTSAAEVVEQVGRLGLDLAPRTSGPAQARDRLEPVPRQVLEAVPAARPAGLASIAATAGVQLREAAGSLHLLSAAGLVVERDGGWVLAPAR